MLPPALAPPLAMPPLETEGGPASTGSDVPSVTKANLKGDDVESGLALFEDPCVAATGNGLPGGDAPKMRVVAWDADAMRRNRAKCKSAMLLNQSG